ncbi:hypothetical protein Patl1_02030 [Pistacia atlantica]|uniref:Uncharacterized protein n=1 Tax=Pistacia atlantica TaxID=434234 RepID=A0ACC1CB80_9ROSI|nr:hypothetical protein Patl1_02030 [Pistacia atlantica]
MDDMATWSMARVVVVVVVVVVLGGGRWISGACLLVQWGYVGGRLLTMIV